MRGISVLVCVLLASPAFPAFYTNTTEFGNFLVTYPAKKTVAIYKDIPAYKARQPAVQVADGGNYAKYLKGAVEVPDPGFDPQPLDTLKTLKNAAITTKTAQLKRAGAPVGAINVPLTDDQLLRVTVLYVNRDVLTYPISFRVAQNSTMTIAKADDVASMYATVVAKYQDWVLAEDTLLTAVDVAATAAEVAAVVDNRK